MTGEGHTPSREPLGNVAGGVVMVTDPIAAAKAGDVLQGCLVIHGVTVRFLHLRASLVGEGRESAW
jgi:hypothetical protein